MFLREMSGDTVSDVATKLNRSDRTWSGVGFEIKPHLDEDVPFLALATPGSSTQHVTVDPEGIKQLSVLLRLPSKTMLDFGNEDPELLQMVFERRLSRHPEPVTIRYGDTGIYEAYKSGVLRVEAPRLVEIISRVIAPNAPVVEWDNNSDAFYMDVVVPEGHDFGVGGDRAEGDITTGGLTIGLNRKNNLAPTVSRMMYRLACTNGYESRDDGLRIDARGASVDQVLAEFERIAREAFAGVEAEIAAFYATRDERIEGDVTQAVLRIAEERGLPDRTSRRMAIRVPEMMNEIEVRGGDGATMFDVINLMTNLANDPAMAGSRTRRRTLYRAGGGLISEHHARCSQCQQRLN